MRRLSYYYNPIVIENYNGRYTVNYYCSDGKNRIWKGQFTSDTYIDTMKNIRNIISALNKPRPLFGQNGRLHQWIWWKRAIRNQKKLTVE